jgi:hypothetical protein
VGLVAGGQFQTGKIRQAGNADKAAVAGPVFFAQSDFLPAHGAAQGVLSTFGVLKTIQNRRLLKKIKKDEKRC